MVIDSFYGKNMKRESIRESLGVTSQFIQKTLRNYWKAKDKPQYIANLRNKTKKDELVDYTYAIFQEFEQGYTFDSMPQIKKSLEKKYQFF